MGKKTKKTRKAPHKMSHWAPVDPKRFAAAWEPACRFLFNVAMREPWTESRKEQNAVKVNVVGGLATILREFFETDEEVLPAATRTLGMWTLVYRNRLGDRQTERTVESSIIMAAAVAQIRSQAFEHMFDVEELKATANRFELQTLMSKGMRKLG